MTQGEKAEEYLAKACEVYSQRFPQSIEFANCLNNFGFLCGPKRPEKEIEQYLRALQIYYSKEPSLAMTKCLSNLAFSYGVMEDFDTAEARYQEACELHEKHFPDTMDFANCLNNRGILQMRQSHYSKAEALLLQAKGLYEQLSPQSADLAQCLDNLGVLLEERGRKQEAQECLEKALCLNKSQEERPSVKRLF
jgi:tetratricopeptide (TPR) repeat protein